MRFITKIIILLALVFPVFVSADIIIPAPVDDCTQEEFYFKKDSITASEYRSAREVVFSSTFQSFDIYGIQKGFCIEKREYCLKTGCQDFVIKEAKEIILGFISLSSHNSVLSPMLLLLNNFILNAFIIFIIYLISRVSLRKFYKANSLGRIALITLLGLLYDFAGVYFSTMIYFLFFPAGSPELFGFILISIFVGITFYWLYSGIISLSRKRRILASIIFGIFSNPLWYLIALNLLYSF